MWLTILLVTSAAIIAAIWYTRKVLFKGCRSTEPKTVTVGFFHPYCNAGGGGERVLWAALKSLSSIEIPGFTMRFVIYSGDVDIGAAETFADVKRRFCIDLAEDIQARTRFVKVYKRGLLEADKYPRFTMIGQSLGSMVVAWEALRSFTPDVWLDTTGCAFTYLVARVLAGCSVACYTHYPTITSDMLSRVHERRPTYNNASDVSQSMLKSYAKVVYYWLFACCYSLMGRLVDVVMVNSTWTKNHLAHLWGRSGRIVVVYPPCNTTVLSAEGDNRERDRVVVSIGQFRPEKDHQLQIQAWAKFQGAGDFKDVKLVIIGGARGAEDQARVANLKQMVEKLGLQDTIEFRVNAPFAELKSLLQTSLLGLHTMWNEHFGICVVEMMAAGVVPIAHNSGGPRSDIVVPYEGHETGYLAATADEYAARLVHAFSNEAEVETMAHYGRLSVRRFSDEEFDMLFFKHMVGLVQDHAARKLLAK